MDNKKTAEIFKALGHPSRLAIVKLLLDGEKSVGVGVVGKTIGLAQANASQHLQNLQYAGIVDNKREGTFKLYFLKNPEIMKSLIKTLEDPKA